MATTSLAAKSKEAKKPAPALVLQSLESLNLADELYRQYVKAEQLLADADTSDEDVPLNQKAQTLNSIVNILGQITKIRTEIYNSERLKALEACLLETLKEFPELSERFLETYEEALSKC